MIKRIKRYFKLQREIQIEVLETLVNICIYLEAEGRHGHNRYGSFMESHAKLLKHYSERLREEVAHE